MKKGATPCCEHLYPVKVSVRAESPAATALRAEVLARAAARAEAWAAWGLDTPGIARWHPTPELRTQDWLQARGRCCNFKG